MKRNLIWSTVITLASANLSAGFGGIAIAPKVGTTGIGGDFVFHLADRLNARVGGTGLSVSPHLTLNNIRYDADIDLLSFTSLIDWHAFDGGFRVSGGVLVNLNGFDLESTPTGTVNIGGVDYTASNVGTLHGHVEYDRVLSPYLGIGYNTAFSTESHWGFHSDLGVFYADSASVTLTATGSVATQDLTQEQQRIQNDLDDWQFYPVLTLGFYYRF